MTVAAFILGVLGFGVAISSLTWQVYTFLMQGARPKLTPIVGFRSAFGLVSIDATRDVLAALASAAKQVPRTGPLLVGVKVVNAGRAPFHLAEWAVRRDPTKTSLNQLEDWLDSPTVPRDIPPGASETFYRELNAAYALAAASKTLDEKQQRIVLTVSSGGRTFKTKPVAAVNRTRPTVMPAHPTAGHPRPGTENHANGLSHRRNRPACTPASTRDPRETPPR